MYKLNRTGEEKLNNFGSKMIIVKYNSCRDIDVYFPQYNYTIKHRKYEYFSKGEIRCPYEPTVYNIGYLGEGKYKSKINGKFTRCYTTWRSMLNRCYNERFKQKHTYCKDCEVCEEWHNFQNFANWYYDNYYEIKNECMHLDKDILIKNNKIYSPKTCVFAPQRINTLFTKCNKNRGKLPIGVKLEKYNKYSSSCSTYDFEENKQIRVHLGYYDTPKKAFEVYKKFKEKYIKEVADYYKESIPQNLYNAMYSYIVDIND